MSGQAVQTVNKKKVKLLRKKRTELRNQKKVAKIQYGNKKVLRKHRPSKKKLQKDAKRRRIVIDAEKAKLLKSGLITEEDIKKMEEEQAFAAEEDVEEGMELEE
jgi:hypothetical protein